MDGGGKLLDVIERASANPLACEFGEPTLNQIRPTTTGGNKVSHEAPVPSKPLLHFGCVVSSIIVHDQMQRRFADEFLIDLAQELKEFLMTMTLVAIGYHLALHKFQGGK